MYKRKWEDDLLWYKALADGIGHRERLSVGVGVGRIPSYVDASLQQI